MGPREQTRLDVDPQSASEMTHAEVPRRFQGLLKDQGVGGGGILEISAPSPKELESSSHSLTYDITQPIKTNHEFRCVRPLQWPTLYLCCVLLSVCK